MKRIIAALVIATALGLGGTLASGADPPELSAMPEEFKNIQIVSPSPNIPKEIADFVGVWEGVWKNRFGFPHPSRRGKLIVFEVFDN